MIPWGTEATVFPPSGFDIYDSRTAVVGNVGGAAYFNDPADVEKFVTMHRALEGLAVFDDEVRALLVRVAAEYRVMAH